VFQLWRSICQIFTFDKGMPLVNALVLGNLVEYRHESYIDKKLDPLGYMFCCRHCGTVFNHFCVIGSKSTEFGKK